MNSFTVENFIQFVKLYKNWEHAQIFHDKADNLCEIL